MLESFDDFSVINTDINSMQVKCMNIARNHASAVRQLNFDVLWRVIIGDIMTTVAGIMASFYIL